MNMKREELRQWFSEWLDDYYDELHSEDELTPEVAESVLAALRPISREQVEKMKKNAVSGQFEDWYGQEFTCPECGHKSLGKGNFCKNCGCPHTDEAVQMVIERLEALKDGKGV